MRNPAATAMELATLARLYPGRLHGGLGHGMADWMRQIGAFPKSQLTALEETIVAVQDTAGRRALTVAGGHVRLDEVGLDHPPRVVPPVSAGVRSVKSLQLSGRSADGTILTELSTPGYLRWAREQIDAGRAEAGRTDPHRITVYALFSHDEDSAKARAAIRPDIAKFLRAGGLSTQLGEAGILAEADALVAGSPDDKVLAAAIPEAWIDLLAIAGDGADCAVRCGGCGRPAPTRWRWCRSLEADDALNQLASASRCLLEH